MTRYAWLVGLLLATSAARADEIGVELGPGFEYSDGDEGLFLGYRRIASPLFGCDSYTEFIAGGWNGSDRALLAGAARGVSFALPDRGRFAIGLGAGYLNRTTENLGTHAQFLLRLGYERDIGALVLGIGAMHFSNGKKVFHWEGANRGENYVVLRVARRL